MPILDGFRRGSPNAHRVSSLFPIGLTLLPPPENALPTMLLEYSVYPPCKETPFLMNNDRPSPRTALPNFLDYAWKLAFSLASFFKYSEGSNLARPSVTAL